MGEGRRQWQCDQEHLRGRLGVKVSAEQHSSTRAVLVDTAADLPHALARHSLADHGQCCALWHTHRHIHWHTHWSIHRLSTHNADSTARTVGRHGLLLWEGGGQRSGAGVMRARERRWVERPRHIHRVTATSESDKEDALAAGGGERAHGLDRLEGQLVRL